MTRINLLPWRELKRSQDKKLFITLISVCCVLATLTVVLIDYWASSRLSNQIRRNNLLQYEIDIYDQQIREIAGLEKLKGKLISRMSLVANLQLKRSLMIHLMDELIKVTPEHIVLTQVEGKNNFFSLSGLAKSNASVSQLMNTIERNEWIHDPVLTEIKKTALNSPTADYEFNLTFILQPKKNT